jgi:hypothetical protein
VVVNNSININQANNNLPPQIIEDIKKKTTRYDVAHLSFGLRHAQKCGGAKPIKRIQTLLSYSNGNTDTCDKLLVYFHTTNQ